MSQNPSPEHVPVLKIGAVVVRAVASTEVSAGSGGAFPLLRGKVGWGSGDADSGIGVSIERPSPTPLPKEGEGLDRARVTTSAHYEILIIRTHAKRAGEVAPFVLPRGSRQYFVVAADGSVAWHDARDAATGAAHANALEPFTRGLEREIEEEAGVDADMLARARVHELGAREFQSRNKGVYPIHWFEVVLAAADAAQLTQPPLPKDTAEMRWASLPDIKEMAARGEFSAGYVPVIEEALALVGSNP